jgi:hypothetical protein
MISIQQNWQVVLIHSIAITRKRGQAEELLDFVETVAELEIESCCEKYWEVVK